MTRTRRTSIVVLVALALGLPSGVFADLAAKARIIAVLGGGPDASATGVAKRNTRLDPADFRDRFKVKVSFAYPNNAFGIDTEDEALDARLTVIVSRNGFILATCKMILDDEDEDVLGDDGLADGEPNGRVSWRLDQWLKDGTILENDGTCTDGIPNAGPGDAVLVVLKGAPDQGIVGGIFVSND